MNMQVPELLMQAVKSASPGSYLTGAAFDSGVLSMAKNLRPSSDMTWEGTVDSQIANEL